ncbi:MAG: hypothetical protein JW724_02275 [Candidatus Altiarchaeota archaeon]|nr:hypothetical protein [Candidatus Altiarchaeota archaeon]
MMKVLDSSSILHSDLDFTEGDYLVTNSVLHEIMDERALVLVQKALKNGSMTLKDPSPESIGKAGEAAKETGDLFRLSGADLDVLALALEEDALILSDDYAIQNVAGKLKLRCQKTVQEGIKKHLVWVNMCPSCSRTYDSDARVCSVCGSRLRITGKTSEGP